MKIKYVFPEVSWSYVDNTSPDDWYFCEVFQPWHKSRGRYEVHGWQIMQYYGVNRVHLPLWVEFLI